MDIRRAIVKRMEEINWSQYALAEKLEGKVPARTVYGFLGKDQKNINLTALGHVIDALGLTIKAK